MGVAHLADDGLVFTEGVHFGDGDRLIHVRASNLSEMEPGVLRVAQPFGLHALMVGP